MGSRPFFVCKPSARYKRLYRKLIAPTEPRLSSFEGKVQTPRQTTDVWRILLDGMVANLIFWKNEMLEAKIKFFDIKRFGYYMRGENASSLGNVSDILQRLNAWANDGRAFSNTTTYEPDPDNDILSTYFCGWSQNPTTQDSLLVLWNQTPNDDGVIYGMNPQSPPGETSMLTTDFGDTPAIPGAPSYIWFVPGKNVFATIRFTHSVQGKVNLDHYLNGYLQNKSAYRVEDADGKVIGYSQNGRATENSARLHPKFEAYGRKQEELEAELLVNINKITKIVKRETLLYTIADDRSVFERVFANLLPNTPSFTQSRAGPGKSDRGISDSLAQPTAAKRP